MCECEKYLFELLYELITEEKKRKKKKIRLFKALRVLTP